MKPEGKVKAAVKALLKRHKVYFHMPVMNGYGAPSLDFIGCHNGLYLAIETKAPGNSPTARQEVTMALINEANGAVFVIGERLQQGKNIYSGFDELEAWLIINAR